MQLIWHCDANVLPDVVFASYPVGHATHSPLSRYVAPSQASTTSTHAPLLSSYPVSQLHGQLFDDAESLYELFVGIVLEQA